MRHVLTGVAVCGAAMTATSAFADFINEPAASGLSAVNITGVYRNPTTGRYAIDGPVFDATGRQLQIGSWPDIPGGLATLTLNNDTEGDYDVIGITGLSLIGVGLNSNGALNVDGAGAFIEGGLTWFGLGSASASVAITNGGRLSGGQLVVGQNSGDEEPQANVSVLVDGAGSRLEGDTITIGGSELATAAHSEITVSNGGVLSAEKTAGASYSRGQIYVGGSLSKTQDDLLRVTGAGSRVEAEDYIGVGGLVGDDRMEVLDGATAMTAAAVVGSAPGGSATLLVSGENSSFSAGADIEIGYGPAFTRFEGEGYDNPVFEPFSGVAIVEQGGLLSAGGAVHVGNGEEGVGGVLTVRNGGVVQASSVIVHKGGELNGDGGTILGDLLVDGGLLNPGASPGALTVDGDLDLIGALVRLEFGGTGEGEYDVLDIAGSLTADSTTEFVLALIGGFEPEAGARFDFLRVAQTLNIADVSFSFENFGGVGGSVMANGQGGFSLFVGEGGASPVPLPASGLLLVAGIGVLAAQRRRSPAKAA